MLQLALNYWDALVARLRAMGEVVPLLLLRVIMAFEFYESGLEKYRGDNWFGDIQGQFPFPFNLVPANLSWGMATYFELFGAVLLLIGLGTRVVAFSLLVLTFVATAAVHWPSMWDMWSDLLRGYAISDAGHGNFKLPLLFSLMLLPLIFTGAGKLSVDHLLARLRTRSEPQSVLDAYAVALALAVFGVPFALLIPGFGIALLAAAAIISAGAFWIRR
jgi:putative oxidoreductase